MFVVTISNNGAGINCGRVKVLKCLKCGKERMIFKLLPPHIDLEAGDVVEGEVVLQFVGKSRSNSGKHFWVLHSGLGDCLLPAGYASWGLPFVIDYIVLVPKEIAKIYRKKYFYHAICDFTVDYPYAHILQLYYNNKERMKAQDELMCPECYRSLTESLQGNLRGRILNFLEIRPRLVNQHQPGVKCFKQQAELFNHSIEIVKGSGSIMVRLPEAVVTSHTDLEKVVVRITHPSHDPVEIEIPDSAHYLYLFHPWPWFRGD